MSISKQFWDKRYEDSNIGWDLGQVSPPLKSYLDQLKDKSIHILIPGAGRAHEAAYLLNKGFRNITLLDISHAAIEAATTLYPELKPYFVEGNFFQHAGRYDLILEQTFFCALDPVLRSKYVSKMAQLLSDDGLLVGLLFNTRFEDDGPPFGGVKADYQKLFPPQLKFDLLEVCYNSIPPRQGNELFFIARKQNN